jgi:hypothetical protein
VVPRSDVFERQLDFMLRNRAELEANNIQPDQTMPMGVSLSYLALVFAVLASGAQCTDLPAKERELTSQVYTCCSYQALRMANFMTHPNLDTIEASLIIGNVLSYNMNPGVAYIFTGMVIRMSYAVGLHMNAGGFTEEENWLRRRVWWALAWQDSHFSISYDRPSSTATCHPDIPYAPNSAPGSRSYAESMYSIIQLTQSIIRDRSMNLRSQMTWSTIQQHKDFINNVINNGSPHLRERSLCTKMTQHLERLALKLHASYVISELCRPALDETPVEPPALTPNSNPVQSPPSHPRRKDSASRSHSASTPASASSPKASGAEARQISDLRRECARSLENTVDAYVELHSYSETAARSWIGIQRAISAAFLLGTLPESNQEPRVLSLLRELERCINQRTLADPTFEKIRGSENRMYVDQESCNTGSEDAPHWARSMTRSLNALGKLNETLAGHKAEISTAPTGGTGMSRSHSQYDQPGMRRQQHLPSLTTAQPQPQGSPYSAPGHLMNRGNQGMMTTGWGPMPSHGSGLPMTPDGSSQGNAGPAGGGQSEWNYGNLRERGAEWIQPALWK